MNKPKFKSLFLSPQIIGSVCAVLAALSFSLSMSITKTVAHDIPTSLIVFFRTFFGMIFFLPFLIKDANQVIKTKQLKLHLLRVIVSVCAMLCTYYTYRHLPLGLATSLGMTGPLFTTLISIIVLKESTGRYKWMLLIIGYLGALFIIKPHNFIFEVAIITSLLANILAGSSIILVKILSKRDSTITIIAYNSIGLCIASALLNYSSWQIVALKDLGLLAIIAFLGISSQYLIITATKHTSPSFIAPFEYIRLIFSFAIGFFFFNEDPDFYTILGSLIILVSTYHITRLK